MPRPGPAHDHRPRPEPVGDQPEGRDRGRQSVEKRPALVMVLAPVVGLLIWAGLALLAI